MATYRKQNLFRLKHTQLSVDETQTFEAGTLGVVVEYRGWTFGLSICFDLRFPEVYRGYREQGCDVMVIPAVFTAKTGRVHWQPLLQARAIENLAYVVAVNQVGTDTRGIEAYGHSRLISPWGEILSEASGQESILLLGDLDHKYVQSARDQLPLF